MRSRGKASAQAATWNPEIITIVVREDNPHLRRKPTLFNSLEGSSPKREMASARDTTGIGDRGMRIEGQLTNLGEPTVSLQKIQPEEEGYRPTKSPGDERAAPAPR